MLIHKEFNFFPHVYGGENDLILKPENLFNKVTLADSEKKTLPTLNFSFVKPWDEPNYSDSQKPDYLNTVYYETIFLNFIC